MLTFQAEPFFVPETEELRHLPEGPRLLRNYPGSGSILGWVAIQNSPTATEGSINLLDLESRRNIVQPLPGRPGFFAETDRPGTVVIGLERSLVLYDLMEGRIVGQPLPATTDEQVIINDGMAIPGGLLFGTKHLTFSERIACMYWFDAATGRIHTLHPSQICANGKFLFEADGRHHLIDIDSFNKTLDRYEVDFAAARLSERRIIADFRQTPLFPDGLRPTPAGDAVVVAFYNPEAADTGLARQFRIADGVVEAEWRLPGSPRVTCPEFIKVNGGVKVLFTTAVEGMPAEMRAGAPLAGALFIADTPFSELPAPPPLFPWEALTGRP